MKPRSLLIVGAGCYATVAYEIANDMGCFKKIGFVDDFKKTTSNNVPVCGTTSSLPELSSEFTDIVVAIGNPDVRMKLLNYITENTDFELSVLISPFAYVSPSAQILPGTIIEPMAVVHSGCYINRGSIISSGAVVGHNSRCEEGVHIDINATVPSYMKVPAKTKLNCGEVFS